ncbi:hypothetical protein CH267_13285 [Rhodococcus sp. 06-621-2]|nr:hypothetical protein CH267_13285 [Rhodococcus sp. 06-621-2]
MALRPASPIPLYYQLAEGIKSAVNAGTIRPGERVGSIAALARTVGIAPQTARRAVDLLVRDGYVTIAKDPRRHPSIKIVGSLSTSPDVGIRC